MILIHHTCQFRYMKNTSWDVDVGGPRKLATPIHPFSRSCNFWILASEGRRDFSDTAKWPQWPHLYKSYEATYTQKRLLFEKIGENWFLGVAYLKIGFLRFSLKVSILRHMLLHNSNRNMAIAVILLYHVSLYNMLRSSYWIRASVVEKCAKMGSVQNHARNGSYTFLVIAID